LRGSGEVIHRTTPGKFGAQKKCRKGSKGGNVRLLEGTLGGRRGNDSKGGPDGAYGQRGIKRAEVKRTSSGKAFYLNGAPLGSEEI